MKNIIIIDNIYCDDKYIYIQANDIYKSPIINGSVSFKIYDNNKNEMYLNNLNINDKIKIYYTNNFIIQKIILFCKYEIISDSSDISDTINYI